MRTMVLMRFGIFFLLNILIPNVFAEAYISDVKPAVVFTQGKTADKNDFNADLLAHYVGPEKINYAKELLVSKDDFVLVSSLIEVMRGATHITPKQMDDDRLIAVHPAGNISRDKYFAGTLTSKGIIGADIQPTGELIFKTKSSKIFYGRAEAQDKAVGT